MNDLVINRNGTPATTQSTVSELTDNNEQSVQKLIRTYEADLKEFGELEFKDELICNSKNKINYKKVYCLNEQQATLLLTYMKNTPKVREAKKILVKAFYEMKQELQALKFQRYVDEIADLNACLIDKTKRHKREIASYKGKLTMAKNQLRAYEFKATTFPETEKLQQELKNAKASAHNYKLDMEFYMRKYRELKKQNEELESKSVKALDAIQRQMEHIFTAIGAVKSFINDGDEYFMKEKGLLKG